MKCPSGVKSAILHSGFPLLYLAKPYFILVKRRLDMKSLNDFPRIPLAVLPTPIQKLENISRILGTNVYIKRDDLTGIGLGGNKVRKLEFLLADAKRQGAEIIFTTGGAQSNHAMLTAACAKKLGMTPILILKKRGSDRAQGQPAARIPHGHRRPLHGHRQLRRYLRRDGSRRAGAGASVLQDSLRRLQRPSARWATSTA